MSRRHSEIKPPYNSEAEQSLLGAILLSEDGEAWDVASPLLTGGEFFSRNHQDIYRAMEKAVQAHGRADATTVAQFLNGAVDKGYLLSLIRQVPSVAAAKTYATIVRDCAHRRHIMRRAGELGAMAVEGATPRPMLERLLNEVRDYETGDGEPEGLVDAWAYADAQPEKVDWLIDGMLARQTRTWLFGKEGGGKSLMALQIAAQASAGIPILGSFVAQKSKVLYCDFENPGFEISSRLRQLRITLGQAGHETGFVKLLMRPEGINLTDPSGQGEVERAVASTRPDILFLDPFYKCLAASANLNDSRDVSPALFFLDRIRKFYNLGIWVCHHPRKSQGGDPRATSGSDLVGSSVVLRWLETLLAIPEASDCIQVMKARSFHPRIKDQARIPFRRGGKWFFEVGDGPVMTDLHREVLKAVAAIEPASTGDVRDLAGKQKQSVVRALNELHLMGKLTKVSADKGPDKWALN